MVSVSDIQTVLAEQPRTFAGLFAYDSNVPMKVFAGQTPCVPIPALLDMAAGTGNEEVVAGGGKAPDNASCQSSCLSACEAKGLARDICSQQCSRSCKSQPVSQ